MAKSSVQYLSSSESAVPKRRWISSLRTQPTLGLGVFLVAGSALYLGLVQPALRRSIIEREHDRMRMYAELVALRIDNPPVGRTDRPSNPPGINVLPSLPKEWRGVLLSQDGKVLASLSPAPAAPVQPAFTGSSGTWRLDAGPHSNEVRVVEVGSQRWHECRRLFGYDAFFFDVVDEPIGGRWIKKFFPATITIV
jgi:hypothetical protein